MQRRGAPHFHMLGAFGDALEPIRRCIEHCWRLACGEWWVPAMNGMTDIRWAESREGAALYLMKDMLKTRQNLKGIYVGRVWGVLNEKLATMAQPSIEFVPEAELFLHLAEISELTRVARKISKEKWDSWQAPHWHWCAAPEIRDTGAPS